MKPYRAARIWGAWIFVCWREETMSMATAVPSLNRPDLDQTLARVSSKPNVSGALVLSKDTGAIIRSTVADNELAKKYCLGVKSTLPHID